MEETFHSFVEGMHDSGMKATFAKSIYPVKTKPEKLLHHCDLD
jgi:hypothetical protein